MFLFSGYSPAPEIFWIDQNENLGVTNLTGHVSVKLTPFETPFSDAQSISTYNGHLYWTDTGRGGVGAMRLDSFREVSFVQALASQEGLHQLSTGVSDIAISYSTLSSEGELELLLIMNIKLLRH